MNAKRLANSARLIRLSACAVLAMAMAQPAFAQGELAVSSDGARVSASATVSFKIVIRENVRFDSKSLGMEQQARKAHMPQVQRLVAMHDDMQQVTLATP
ncbi:hypothetical protein [Arenimonas donghaensis]|uniref:SIMPL domain-containing protein n=1 Tax=Arenimonas donghaensis DSM 18148 = HO3-R19 TaxID=1121014 RepID=A0A087MJ71_9GAMM|nr:hypothetical protein [Arenimonas donghaensis]KFL36924.1 hypothetical protein N788_12410 [Arenimonas donghaensis DSM 18148 = HO3-R19]